MKDIEFKTRYEFNQDSCILITDAIWLILT